MTANALSAGDTAWVLVSTGLVMLMVPGLSLFYGGLVREKNSLNTLMMSVAPLGVVGVLWVLVGYSLAFDRGSPVLGGLGFWGLAGVGAEPNAAYAGTVPHVAFAAYQGMFAAITVSLISGAVVERLSFRAYLLFGALWTLVVYSPLAHWVWGEGGWLRALGALDFAGGTVVHVSAGTAALVAAVMLGRRARLAKSPAVPHNVPFTLLGAGLLWFGWFGFNGGSALAANGVAAGAVLTTHTAAAAALTTWMLLDLLRTGTCTAVGAATGAVVGLVAITPAAGFVTPGAALAIGAVAACASHAMIQLRARTGVDDALDVFACHGAAGVVGALLTGVFATRTVNPGGADGLLAGNPHQLLVQLLAVLGTMAFAGVATAGLLTLVRALHPLRVSLDVELAGVDVAEHGEHAYHGGLGELTGGRVPLGDGVLVAAHEIAPALPRPASAA